MRVTGSRAYARSIPVPKMPSGLVELMEGLSKEVLRNNPENIYDFCASHMLKLLEIRDENPFRKNAVLLDRKIQLIQEKIRRNSDKKGQHIQNVALENSKNIPDSHLSISVKCFSPIDNGDKIKSITIDNKHAPLPCQELSLSGNSEIEISHESMSMIENNQTDSKLQIKLGDASFQNHLPKYEKTNDKTENGIIDKDITASKISSTIKEQETSNKIISSNPEINYTDEENTLSNINTLLEAKENVSKNNFKILENSTVHDVTKAPGSMFLQTDIEHEILSHNPDASVNDKMKCINDSFNPELKTKDNFESYESLGMVEEKSCNEIDAFLESENKTTVSKEASFTSSDAIEKVNQENVESNLSQDIKSIPNLENNSVLKSNTTPIIATVSKDSEPLHDSSQPKLNPHDDSDTEFGTLSKQEKPISKSTLEEVAESVTSKNDVTNENKNTHLRVNEPNTNMDLETAAITIQKVFRSFLFKSRASTCDSNDENNSLDEDSEKKELSDFSNLNLVKERRSLGLTRMDTVLQTVNEEKSLSLSTDDSSTLSSAATVIQAHVRGFLVRNKFKSNKTASTSSIPNSDPSPTSREKAEVQKSKTVLNIHLVSDGTVSNISRDESILTSMELSLDGSPPSSVNLHPLGYNKSEPRKQLKREDAIQSVSPPSNNSGKLSEDVDSVKEVLVNDTEIIKPDQPAIYDMKTGEYTGEHSTLVENIFIDSLHDHKSTNEKREETNTKKKLLRKMTSDEMDVVTPFINNDKNDKPTSLINSGELHDIVLPTKVSRSDATIVRADDSSYEDSETSSDSSNNISGVTLL